MERKKPGWLGVMLVAGLLLLALAACSGQTTAPDAAAGAAGLTDTYPDAITIKNQLLLGTLRLEDTAQAVSSEQAEVLLPLWQLYASLTASSTAATEETESVQNQIIDAMSQEQIAAIAEMQLTNEDLQAFYVEAGLSEAKTPEPDVTPQSTRMSALPKEDREATRVASGESTGTGSGGGSGKSASLIDLVITVLEAR